MPASSEVEEIVRGQLWRSSGVQMYCDHHPDSRGDPTVEVWFFTQSDEDGTDGDGHLEIFVDEVVRTEHCGVLAVYHRQWFNPEGERLWGRKRVIGNLASLRALIRRRKMALKGSEG